MGTVDKAVNWAINIANDDSHGYDQGSRWSPDYDCSSLVISAYQQAGAPVKTNGATYTGNMKPVFLKSGFSDVTVSVDLASGNGLQRGDVLLNVVSHTAMYIGNGKIVHATGNENGSVRGGRVGDQTGREICIANYFNFPWNCVLRYTGDSNESGSTPNPVTLPYKVGDTVYFKGGKNYTSSDGSYGFEAKATNAKITNMAVGALHPYHVIGTNGGVYGWVDLTSLQKASGSPVSESPKQEVKQAGTYTVKWGDNLWTIAFKTLGSGSRYKEIMALNNMSSDKIWPGTILKIPEK